MNLIFKNDNLPGMKKFLIKTAMFFLPFLFITMLYLILDPFKVIYSYDSYFDQVTEGVVFLNTNYTSTTNFENHYNEFVYNSFIFGNSRAWFIPVSEWKKHIGDEPAYHFDAGGEALYSIHRKLNYLDKNGVEIKNALLVLDHEILSQDKPKNGHLGLDSPQVEDYKNYFEFHMASLKGFFNLSFLYAYIDFKLTGKIKHYMVRNKLIDHRPFTYDYTSNEIKFSRYEELIERGEYYNEERMSVFFPHDSIPLTSPATIYGNQKQLLEEIFAIFDRHQTMYKIIISPLYSQEKLASEDLEYLNSLFGQKDVFDFSGKNNITDDYRNYYESSHFRPHVAAGILDIVYEEDEFHAKKKY